MISVKAQITADGSSTLYSGLHRAYYHSLNGAIQESLHIFINAGFNFIHKPIVSILEVGFGSGLNAALTARAAFAKNIHVNYSGVDLYPLATEQLKCLNYGTLLDKDSASFWDLICNAPWGVSTLINEYFSITKIHSDFTTYQIPGKVDLIYFDAFAPEDQPEMWEPDVFQKLYKSTSNNGILITYSAKGIVKRALRSAGYQLERLQGPPGKRHIIRARKPDQ